MKFAPFIYVNKLDGVYYDFYVNDKTAGVDDFKIKNNVTSDQ